MTSAIFEAEFVFSLFDFDDDGRLQLDDFKEVCSFFTGTRLPASVAQSMWQKLDIDADGYVSKHDFIKWIDGTQAAEFDGSTRRYKSESRVTPPQKAFGSLLEVYLHLKTQVTPNPRNETNIWT